MERLTDPLTTIDAKLWADEFMKVKARLGEQEFDHAMMLGWFANAIMVGYDEGSRRAKADAQATVEALQARVQELEARQHFGACAKCLTNAWRICKEDAPNAVEMKCSDGSTWWKCDYCAMTARLAETYRMAQDSENERLDLRAEVEALQRELEHAKKMEAVQKEVADNQTWHVRELRAALDAEREKVKGLHEVTKVICAHCCEPMEIPSKAALQSHLSTLQGLVRAISETMEPFRLSLAKLDEVDTLATRRIAEADAYYCAQRVLSTLPATPTEEAPVKGGDGE